jgi:hypothetical protein
VTQAMIKRKSVLGVFVATCLAVVLWYVIIARPKTASPEPAPAKRHPTTVAKQPFSGISQIPELLPGATCEKAIEVFGRPTEESEYVLSWDKENFEVIAAKNSRCILTSIEARVQAGHTARTADGVTLGATSVADAERMLRSRIMNDSEAVEAPEGNWAATITLGPDVSYPYKSTYRSVLGHGVADGTKRDPVFGDFRSLTVSEHSLEMVAPNEVR